MPYFQNETTNLLFIHIPKTGGTSVETYFSRKLNIPLNEQCLYTPAKGRFYKNNVSYQHQTYLTLLNNAEELGIYFEGITILSIVRNPYDRVISDLFFYKMIETDSEQISERSIFLCS